MTPGPQFGKRLFSARRPVALGLLTLAALLVGALGWGAFASISGAVIAPGRVEVESRAQAVEHIDGGTVKAVLVRNGDRVAAGAVLIRLDDGELRTEEAVLAAEHAELVARRNRLEAEYRDADAIRWDAALARWAEADAGVQTILDGQLRLFEARRGALAGQVAQLRERIAQTQRQIASLEAQLGAVRRQAEFLARELAPFRELFAEGRVELQQLMERERAAARLDGEAGDIGARIAAARSRMAEIELQILQVRANRLAEAEGEVREAQARETQVRERLAPGAGPSCAHGGAGARAGRGVRDAGVRAGGGGAPGRADPEDRAGGRGAGGAGDAGPDPCRPGVAGTGGAADVPGIYGSDDAGLQGTGTPGGGGREPGPADRACLVRGRDRDWRGRRTGGRAGGRGLGGPAVGAGRGLVRGRSGSGGFRNGDRAAGADAGAVAGHAGGGASAHGRSLAAQLSGQAAERLFLPLAARGMRHMAMLRPNRLHTFLASMLALGLLAGCAVRPAPLTERDTAERVAEDRRALAANRPALNGPLTLHRAMAYALLYNLNSRVKAMEQALALGELEADRLGLLPGLSARYGATTRSNVRASSSRSVRTGLESLSASSSSDRTARTGNLRTVWHALDFGVSWYAARQQSDRVLIAHERRRKAVLTVLAEVRRAWWRAAAAERALGKVGSLTDRVKAALADSARIAELRVRSPLEALRYRRALLRALEVLEQQQREGRRTRLELAELIGLGPGLAYRLTLPPEPLPAPRQPVLDTASLETLALRQRPELREAQLSGRIAAAEVRKALLRVLPGLELSAGAHTDSNSFLLNDNWAALGAQVSVNLKQLFAAPAAMGAARAGQALERARREELAMAVPDPAPCRACRVRGGASAVCDGPPDRGHAGRHRRRLAVRDAPRCHG